MLNIKMSVPNAVTFITERHGLWYRVLKAWCEKQNFITPPEQPRCEILYGHVNRAGRYHPREHVCQYTISYAMLHGEDFDETVAHEMCHAFQKAVSPDCIWHGEIFSSYFVTCAASKIRSVHMTWTQRPLVA